QDLPHLLKDRAELRGLEMYDGIKRHDSSEASVREVGTCHVVHAKLNPGVEARRHFDHARGEVGSDHRDTLLVQVAGDMSGPAAEVGHDPPPARRFGETIQQMAV